MERVDSQAHYDSASSVSRALFPLTMLLHRDRRRQYTAIEEIVQRTGSGRQKSGYLPLTQTILRRHRK